jgi:UDP-2,3-diacylglucosamine pyrophosphatase LpxH
MRDIFVISDLHLGDGGVRDNFEAGGRTGPLHQFVDHVGAEGGELFILGDLFELWQMNTSRILVHRRPLLDHFVQLPLVYVPGNHDVDLVHFIGTGFLQHPLFTNMRRPFERQLGGRRFRFFHGHELDRFNASEDPGFGQMLTIFAGLFEDQNKSPLLASGEAVEAVLEQFGESMLALWTSATAALSARVGISDDVEPRAALTPAQNPDRLAEHLQGLRLARLRDGWDAAVLGHTHKLGCVGDWYHNSGTWVGSTPSFLRIDPEGHVRYFEWNQGRAVEHQARSVLPDGEPEKNVVKKAMASLRLLFPRPTPPERSRLLMMAEGALALGLGVWASFHAHTRGRPSRSPLSSGPSASMPWWMAHLLCWPPRASSASSVSSIECEDP